VTLQRAGNAVREGIAKAAAETLKTVVKHAKAVGADVSSIARRAVDGVREGAIETGQDVGQITEAAVKSAIKAAGRVGSKSERSVGDVLAGVVLGIDDVFGEAPSSRSIARKSKVAVTKSTRASPAVRRVARASERAGTASKTTVKRAAKKAAKRVPVRDHR
jgi:hypothetical protein